ncbi:MAG: tungstate ABC transporter substrate-binding protein WtpA [Eubacteriales bacterium]
MLTFIMCILSLTLILSGCSSGKNENADKTSQTSQDKTTLNLYGAGTLATPFRELTKAFEAKYPNIVVHSQFGGSVKMVKQVTELKQPADIVAVADYSVIPKYMMEKSGQKYADWYIGFATNGITFVYTDRSKGADKINADNWYQVLAQPGVQIGRSNPDTDPSGYQTLQMLNLAEKYYKKPGLAQAVLKNAPKSNIRDTETELLSALEAGQIDYLAIYRSDARQHGLKYLNLPADIDLSDAKYSASYKDIKVTTKNGQLTGKPIVYAITVPTTSSHKDLADKYLAFLLSPEGQSILKKDGFGQLQTPYANQTASLPTELKPMVTLWPK